MLSICSQHQNKLNLHCYDLSMRSLSLLLLLLVSCCYLLNPCLCCLKIPSMQFISQSHLGGSENVASDVALELSTLHLVKKSVSLLCSWILFFLRVLLPSSKRCDCNRSIPFSTIEHYIEEKTSANSPEFHCSEGTLLDETDRHLVMLSRYNPKMRLNMILGV